MSPQIAHRLLPEAWPGVAWDVHLVVNSNGYIDNVEVIAYKTPGMKPLGEKVHKKVSTANRRGILDLVRELMVDAACQQLQLFPDEPC